MKTLHSLARLRHNINVLGWHLGWRFWKIENHSRRHPDFALEWAELCIKEGNKRAVCGKQSHAHCMWDWAEKLKASHANFTARQFDATMTPSK